MKELTEAFKKAQQVQEGAKRLQEELEQMEITGESGGGLVQVVISGNQEPLRVTISITPPSLSRSPPSAP
jgi:DNA-binding YbaB/EbfC family protein